jgi:hypothetical protein
MRLSRRICTFVNDADRCGTDAQACKERIAIRAIVAAVVRRLAAGARDLRPIGPKGRQPGEINGVTYRAVRADSWRKPETHAINSGTTAVREHSIPSKKDVVSHRA